MYCGPKALFSHQGCCEQLKDHWFLNMEAVSQGPALRRPHRPGRRPGEQQKTADMGPSGNSNMALYAYVASVFTVCIQKVR